MTSMDLCLATALTMCVVATAERFFNSGRTILVGVWPPVAPEPIQFLNKSGCILYYVCV